MKKFLIKSICLILVTVTTFSLCGCSVVNYPEEFVVGDFRVRYLSIYEEKDPDAYLCLVGLSKEGEQKKTIVLPKRIDGHPYYLWFKQRSPVPGYVESNFLSGAEKIYLGYPGNYSQEEKQQPFLYVSGCSKMRKVFVNINASTFSSANAFEYYNYVYYLIETTDDEKITIDDENKELIVGQKKRLANLQYKYNFKGAENFGYYWIDDIDNGEKIEVTPDTPEREGYTFGGWYTEEECVNKFDFDTVFNKPVLEEGDIYPDDYVTYLYAKWIQNEG